MARLPPAVAPGSRVAVVFPAGRPNDDQAGLELLRRWELEPVVHDPFGGRIKDPNPTDDDADPTEHFMARCFNTCLPDKERARALEDAFLDDSCDAVICGRGGYGCMRILELLDWERLTPAVLRSKRFVGFSDITALHLAFQTVAPGLVTLHGPMPASCFKSITQSDAGRLRAALFSDVAGAAFAPLPGLMLNDAAAPSPRPQCTRVLGRLVGGNLALLSVRKPTRTGCYASLGVPVYVYRWYWTILSGSACTYGVAGDGRHSVLPLCPGSAWPQHPMYGGHR